MGSKKKVIGIITLILVLLSLISFMAWGFSHIMSWKIAILVSVGIYSISTIFGVLVRIALYLIIGD